jgi:hypothetical protein
MGRERHKRWLQILLCAAVAQQKLPLLLQRRSLDRAAREVRVKHKRRGTRHTHAPAAPAPAADTLLKRQGPVTAQYCLGCLRQAQTAKRR